MNPRDSAYVLPNYFYEAVSKELGIPKETVDKVYRSYIKNLTEALKKDGNVYVRKLGTLTAKPKTLFGMMHEYIIRANRRYELVGYIDMRVDANLRQISTAWKKLLDIKSKYEYIEGGLEKFRPNLGRFEELFDNEGFYTGTFETKDGHLQELPIEERV